MFKTVYISFFLLFAFGTTTFSQTIDLEENNDSDSLKTVTPSSTNDTPNDDPYGVFDIFDGNPGRAALYALILPGAGQVYNRQYWKVPVALAAEGLAIYNLSQEWQDYNQWDTDWKLMVNNQPPLNTTLTSIQAVKEIRDDERAERDQAWLYAIGVHIIVTADAFISRHLIEFDVDDDISIKMSPLAPIPGFNLVMNF